MTGGEKAARAPAPAWKRSFMPWRYASRRGIIIRLVVAAVVTVLFLVPALLPTRVEALSNEHDQPTGN